MATISLNGTYYNFTVTAANATVGATYTNNSVTYTVNKTIAGGTTLICTGTASSVTSGTTLTKATGTGDATITFSAVSLVIPVNEVTYASGDTIAVSKSQEFLINATPTTTLGPVQATSTTPGTISIENTSTTTPIVVSLSGSTSDLVVAGSRNNLDIQGDWIQIATGTGATGQTLDFNTVVGGVLIDYPPCVFVETGDTRHKQLTVGGVSGYYMPFFNIGQAADTSAITMLTTFYGGLDEGPVFQWNNTTKIATFGNGGTVAGSNGGAVIPNGAKVIYPNIHITSTSYTATAASRNEFRISDGGNVTADKVFFSKNWSIGQGTAFTAAGRINMSNIAIPGRTTFSGIAGLSSFNNFVVTIDPDMALTSSSQLYFNSNTGEISTDYIWAMFKTTSTYAPIVFFGTSTKISSIGTIWSWHCGTPNSAVFAVHFEAVAGEDDAPLMVGPLYITGGSLFTRVANNLHIREINHADTCDRVNQTTASTLIYSNNGARNITIAKVRAINANSSACRSAIGNFAQDGSQYAVKDIIYDGKSNSTTLGSHAGKNGYVANVTFDNPRTAAIATPLCTKDVRVSNVRSSLITVANMGGGLQQEWFSSTTSSFTTASPFDVLPAQLIWTDSGRTAGVIMFNPTAGENNVDYRTIVTGTEGTDWYNNVSYLYYEGNGVEIQWEHPVSVRGITDFSGATLTTLGTSVTTNATIEFAMKSYAPESTWNSWYDASTGANWQTALDELDNYDSDKGFFLKWRIVTTAALAGRNVRRIYVTCTPDSTWTPEEIGYVPLTVSGYVSGSSLKLYDNTVPATPVSVYAYTMTGDSRILNFPYNFDAAAKDFRVKTRKAGYGEVNSTGETYQKGKAVLVSQTQYVSVNEVTAAAITGISINGATETVTISSNRSLSEIYDYCQWWAMQLGNMDYEIPITTTDGVSYTGVYDFVVNAGIALTGTGTVDLGANSLTMGSGASSTFDWAYSSTKAWTRISVTGLTTNSRVRINNTTDNIELHNAVVAATSLEIQGEHTADKVLDVRVTYVNGTSAKLPFQQSANFTSSGASIIVSQEDDDVYNTNAISGASVTEFSADYPNIEVDINDGDGVTSVKRLYAAFQYMMHSSQGIVYFFNGITAQDTLNYQINTAVVDLKLDNVGILPVIIADAYIYRDDGTTIIESLSPSIQMDPKRAYGVGISGAKILNTNTQDISLIL